jgi:hypothetical protein
MLRFHLFNITTASSLELRTTAMSAQNPSSDQNPNRHCILDEKTAGPETHTIHSMSTTRSDLEDLNSSLAGCGATTSTKVLQEPADGKPGITLTTYTHEQSTSRHSSPLLHLSKPVDPSPYTSSSPCEKISGPPAQSIDRALVEQENPEIMRLERELAEHFQDLKGEFEGRTGRRWVPLRAWLGEKWEWDSDGEGNKEEELEGDEL